MGRFDQVRANLRKAYEASRDNIRGARVADHDSDKENGHENGHEEPPPSPRPSPRRFGDNDQGPPPRPPRIARASDDDAVPRGLRIAASWSWRLIVIGIVAYALLWIIGHYLLLVAPLMIGLLLTGLLMPAQRALVNLRVNRSLAALLVVAGGLAVLGGTLTLVINQFLAGFDDMVRAAERGVLQIQDWLQNGPLNMSEADLQAAVEEAQKWLAANTQQVTQGALAAVTGTIQFLTGMLLVLVVTFFFLRDGRRIWKFLLNLLPAAARAPMGYAGDGGWGTLGGYVRATVLVALVDAVGIGIGLQILAWTMSFPSALVLPLAALVFLGAFVPIVGAFVSGAVAVLVGLVSGETPTQGLVQALIVLGIVLVVQQLESNVLQPFIVSKMVRIHPLAVIIAVTAGILMAGILGALVAVPVVAVLNTVVRRLNEYQSPPPPIESEPNPETG